MCIRKCIPTNLYFRNYICRIPEDIKLLLSSASLGMQYSVPLEMDDQAVEHRQLSCKEWGLHLHMKNYFFVEAYEDKSVYHHQMRPIGQEY